MAIFEQGGRDRSQKHFADSIQSSPTNQNAIHQEVFGLVLDGAGDILSWYFHWGGYPLGCDPQSDQFVYCLLEIGLGCQSFSSSSRGIWKQGISVISSNRNNAFACTDTGYEMKMDVGCIGKEKGDVFQRLTGVDGTINGNEYFFFSWVAVRGWFFVYMCKYILWPVLWLKSTEKRYCQEES